METTNITEVYMAFVDVPNSYGGYTRYLLQKHTPDGIVGSGCEDSAKHYARKKDAEKAALWLRDNIRPRWYNGLNFTAKGKRCGVIYKKIVETREETFG